MSLMILFVLGSGLWFLYDGFYDWPKKNDAARAEYQRLVAEGQEEEWPTVAQENKWERNKPGYAFTDDKIIGQYVFGALGLVIGGIILGYVLMSKGRTLRVDDEQIYPPAGDPILLTAITNINKAKWDDKGIAVVRYRTGESGQAKLKIDDIKFKGADAVLAHIEKRLEEIHGPRTGT